MAFMSTMLKQAPSPLKKTASGALRNKARSSRGPISRAVSGAARGSAQKRGPISTAITRSRSAAGGQHPPSQGGVMRTQPQNYGDVASQSRDQRSTGAYQPSFNNQPQQINYQQPQGGAGVSPHYGNFMQRYGGQPSPYQPSFGQPPQQPPQQPPPQPTQGGGMSRALQTMMPQMQQRMQARMQPGQNVSPNYAQFMQKYGGNQPSPYASRQYGAMNATPTFPWEDMWSGMFQR